MQRGSSRSVINGLYIYSISDQFMDITKHKQIIENARKSSGYYDNLCIQFQNYYNLIHRIPDSIRTLLEGNVQAEIDDIVNFKIFLQQMFQIFSTMSDFQIDGLSSLRNSCRQDDIDCYYDKFINNLQQCSSIQSLLKITTISYKCLIEEIQLKQRQLQKKLKKVEYIFNSKLLLTDLQSLTLKLSQKQKLQQQLITTIDKIGDNSSTLDQQLMFYRQKLISTKYEVIQKMCRLCKNQKQSLMEMITILIQFLGNKKDMFVIDKYTKSKQRDIIVEKRDISSFIISMTNKYQNMLEQYKNIIGGLIDCFTKIGEQGKILKMKQVEIIQSMNKYYQYNQCRIGQILHALDLYAIFVKYIGEMADKLTLSYNTLIQIQKNVKKHTQISLTLLKCSSSSQKRFSPTHKQTKQQQNKNDPNKYLDYLFDQMSQSYIQNIILKIYNDFKDSISRIKDDFLIVNPDKRKTLGNSMSMSYVSEITTPKQKRPAKKQLWLWKDWRTEINKQIVDTNDLEKFTKEYFSIFADRNAEEREIDKINCTFLPKKIRGVLKLKPTNIQYESVDSSVQLYIPFNKIESVDMLLSIMNQTLQIVTVYGELVFAKQNLDIKNFYVQLKKSIDLFIQNNQQNKVASNKIIITPQELTFIEQRKKHIAKDIQNISNYDHFNSVIIPQVDITDFYKVIYSDDPIVIKGKQYACFPDSLMKKYNNTNPIYQKFDKNGPEYYTNKPGVNFMNCPFVSMRHIDYDHKLPKMPFMPELCHNRQNIQIFWISQNQFHVKQHNFASGAPYTQDFNVVNYIIIKQIQQNVKVDFYLKIIEVRDFSFKTLVLKTAVDQAKWGTSILISEMKKIMLGYKNKPRQQGTNETRHNTSITSQQNSVIIKYKNTINQLTKKNKILIGLLIAVFIINILLNVVF